MSSQGDETRRRALDATIDLFARSGWRGFTIHAVSKRSRVSLGSLYHHFGSMDGVAAAAWTRSIVRLLDSLVARCAPKRTARASVEALVLGYLDFTEQHRPEALFIHASSWASFMPEHAASIARAKEAAFAPLVAHFQAHARALVPASPALLELVLIGPAAETARRWLSHDPAIDLAEARRVLPGATWRAVRLDK